MRWAKFKPLKPLIAFLIGVIFVGVLAKPLYPAQPGLNLLISFSPPGDVKFKRQLWKIYRPAQVGTTLGDGDRLLLTKQAKAEVMCQNLTTWVVPNGRESVVSEGCRPIPNPRLVQPGEDTANTRAINHPEIPYLISPRDTKLLNSQSLTLRWNPVEGAKSYRVKLIGPNINWSQETTESQLVYSGEPPLNPGVRYWFTVQTEQGRTSTTEGIAGFSILTEKEAQEILAAVEKFKQTQPSPEALALATARLYQSNQLNAEAIDVLETTIRAGVESTAIYQLLAKIYQQVGLNQLAREYYLKGLELAQAENNLEGLAITQEGLAITNTIIGNENEALEYLRNAQAAYQELGNKEKVRQLDKKEAEILGQR